MVSEEDTQDATRKIQGCPQQKNLARTCSLEETIGRLIQRENLFFRADVARHHKKHHSSAKSMTRKRKPYGLKAMKPHEIIEFDMKHLYVEGKKLYAMCAIDTFTREAAVRVSGTATSYQAREMLKGLVQHFGKDITIVCDNGSENGGFAEQWLAEEGITQYWAKPHRPKDKPFDFDGGIPPAPPMSSSSAHCNVSVWIITTTLPQWSKCRLSSTSISMIITTSGRMKASAS